MKRDRALRGVRVGITARDVGDARATAVAIATRIGGAVRAYAANTWPDEPSAPGVVGLRAEPGRHGIETGPRTRVRFVVAAADYAATCEALAALGVSADAEPYQGHARGTTAAYRAGSR